MNYTEKVIRQSNYWYNDGLKRANIRDLSGAIVSLRRSLQYCRENIAARNLLGLVYYGRGEINEALVEWIISKNLKPRDNIANYFIRRIQENHDVLDKLNSNIKKYNQCLAYCNQGAEDLAYIQLKKIVSANPPFLKAMQLMAMLCIQNRHYNRAKQLLKKAQKIDITDGITLYLLNELEEIRMQGKRSVEDKEEVVTYKVGNELIIQPASSTLSENATTLTIIHIIIGVVLGVGITSLLIVPTFKQTDAYEQSEAIRTYSDTVNAQEAQINALKVELEEYRTTDEEQELNSEIGANTQTSYERLLEVEALSEGGLTSNADMAALLSEITIESLGESGLALYNSLFNEIVIEYCDGLYATAEYQSNSAAFYNLSETLEKIIAVYPEYKDYEAMYWLAENYSYLNDDENALVYYNRLVEEAGDTEASEKAKAKLEEI